MVVEAADPRAPAGDEVPDRGSAPDGPLGGRFWRLWTATSISNLGDGMKLAALPLLAASLTDDPRLVAGLAAVTSLPWLGFSLLAGALVDRHDRRRLMCRVDLVRAGLVGLLAVLVATDLLWLPLLYGLTLLLGIGETIFDSASQALVPELVHEHQLPRANGHSHVGELVGNQFVGPPLGALLFATVTAAPFALDAASFLAAVLLVGSIRGRYGPAAAVLPTRSLRSEIGEGLRWLAGHRLLRSLAIVMCLTNLGFFMAESILVLFAVRELDVGEGGYGFLLTAMAAGGLVGGLVAARLTQALGEARCIALAVAGLGASILAMGLASGAVPAGVAVAGAGFVVSLWNVVTISLRQRIIPRHLLGRVNSAYRTVGMGSMPVGAVVGGVLARTFGLRFPFVAGAALLLAALAVALGNVTDRAVALATAAANDNRQPSTA